MNSWIRDNEYLYITTIKPKNKKGKPYDLPFYFIRKNIMPNYYASTFSASKVLTVLIIPFIS